MNEISPPGYLTLLSSYAGDAVQQTCWSWPASCHRAVFMTLATARVTKHDGR